MKNPLAIAKIGGLVLVGALLIGVVGANVTMIQIFHTLDDQEGGVKASLLSQGVSNSLSYSYITLPIAGVGAIALLVGIVGHFRGKRQLVEPCQKK